MKNINLVAILAITFLFSNCADDKPFLSGYIKRASAGLMTPCDPYNQNQTHTCIVYATAFAGSLVIYNASMEEMVLSPMGYFPLKVKVGPAVSELVQVASQNPKFPYILALDTTAQSLYPVRVFRNGNKKVSFSQPSPQSIPKPSFKVAAYEEGDKVFALLLNETSVDVLRMDNQEGKLDGGKLAIPLGLKLSHIQIHREGKKAFISDEGDTKMYTIDLTNLAADVAAGTIPVSTPHVIGEMVDKIYLSNRNLGAGEKPYLAGLEMNGKRLFLFEAGPAAVAKVAEISLDESPLSVYFPDKSSEPCCNGKKEWLQVATVKGKMLYFSINNQAGVFSFLLAKTIDLTSKQVLGVSNIHIRTMVGGKVEVESSLKRENPCKNNRKVFWVSSYASRDVRGPHGIEPVEEEDQVYECEGGGDARRLGAES